MRIERVIGRGASSTVYLATQTRFERQVAVKVVDLPGRDDVAAKLFRTECRTLGRLTDHPDIVTVFDAGTTDAGQPFLVMAYLPGGTLAARIEERTRFDAAEATSIGVRLAGALETAHRQGIVHGDVKPQNVLCTSAGDPALADFGIARLLGSAASTRLSVLTPLHAAPELFDGQPPTVRTDVYGLGSTLFELLDGRPPAGDSTESPLAIVARVARGERRSLDRTTVPPRLADVVERAIAQDPDERFATMAELGAALQGAEAAAGDAPTRMVVLDPSPAPDPVLDEAADGTGEGGDGDGIGDGDGPDGRDTIPPPGLGPSVGRRRAIAAAAAVLVLAVLGVVIAVNARSDDGTAGAGDRPEADVAGESTDRGSDGTGTTTGGSLPEGPNAGVQPGVEYDVRGVDDTSPELALHLQDTAAILAPFGSTDPVLDSVGLPLSRTPASLHYQAFSQSGAPGCAGFMSREVTVTGMWSKNQLQGADGLVKLTVVQFATEEQASEAFVGFSVEQATDPSECSGFRDDFGVADYSELDVVHRDPALVDLPPGTRYNSWLKPAPLGFDQNYAYGLAGVVQHGDVVVLFVQLTSAAVGPPDAGTLGTVLSNVLGRL